MREWGRLSLELLFVALLYTAVGVVLGVFSAGWGKPLDLILLLLQNLLAIIPLVFFIWKVEGTWWSVGGTCVLAMALLQVVVPRMEMMLERGQSLIQLPTLALNAVGAAAAAVVALMMMLRSWKNGGSLPPYFWPAGEPVSYLWRVPVFAGAFAVLHVLVARLGRVIFGQTSHPPMLGELVARASLAALLILPVMAVTAHLGVRSRRRLLVLLGVVAVIPAIGRWQLLGGWPVAYLSARVGLRLAADAGVALVCALLMLVRIPSRVAEEPVTEPTAAVGGEDDDAVEVGSVVPNGYDPSGDAARDRSRNAAGA